MKNILRQKSATFCLAENPLLREKTKIKLIKHVVKSKGHITDKSSSHVVNILFAFINVIKPDCLERTLDSTTTARFYCW